MLPAQRKNWCATRVHCDALRRRPEVWAPGSDIFLAAEDVPPKSPLSKHEFMGGDHAECGCRSGDASCTNKNWCATRVHCDALRRRPEVWAPGSDIFLAAEDVPPKSPHSKHGFMSWDHAECGCRSGDASCTKTNWCATRVHCDALRRRPEVWAPGSDIFLAARDVPPKSPHSKHGFTAWDHAESGCRSGDASYANKNWCAHRLFLGQVVHCGVLSNFGKGARQAATVFLGGLCVVQYVDFDSLWRERKSRIVFGMCLVSAR